MKELLAYAVRTCHCNITGIYNNGISGGEIYREYSNCGGIFEPYGVYVHFHLIYLYDVLYISISFREQSELER
jgi:hypothetical protein